MNQKKAGKKAISPIIATIIILLVTIAIAGAGYSYISAYWSGLLGKQIEVVSSFCAGEGQAKIMVKNIGTNPVRTGEITIINPNTGEDLTQDISWSSSVSDPNLVLELKLDEGSGTTAKDTSGQGNDGTLLPSGSGPTWTDGKIGGALSFDGAGDYVAAPLLNLGTEHTISVWAKGNKDNTIMIGRDGNEYSHYYYSNEIIYAPSGGGGAGWSHTIPDTNWHHYLITRNGSSITLYIDGVSKGTQSGSATNTLSIDDIGMASNSWYWEGLIDEVRLYTQALSEDEIKALYENSVPVQPGETATFTHACSGRCSYSLVLGGAAKETMVEC